MSLREAIVRRESGVFEDTDGTWVGLEDGEIVCSAFTREGCIEQMDTIFIDNELGCLL